METNLTSATNTIVVPTYDELMKEFDWVSHAFKPGQATGWQLHESCQNVPVASLDSFELVHFGQDMTDEAAFEGLKSRGMRPTALEDLRTYARADPDKRNEFPIVAIGSSCFWYGRRFSPYLSWGGNNGRCLRLSGSEYGWNGRCRYLAVRA